MAPAVMISSRAAARLRAGYPWVWRDDVVRPPDGDGDVVRVVEARGGGGGGGGGGGAVVGSALWSAVAPVALRLLSLGDGAASLDEALLDARLRAALARRLAHVASADAYRVAHGEADQLPGLFVDRYADVAVVQTMCAAMDARAPLVAEVVARVLGARVVVARDDGSARDFESLPRRRVRLRGDGPTRVRFHDAGSPCEADVLVDGKTGGFLDQQENHARAGEYARARKGGGALDCFTYHGGFALALARAGMRVTAVDESPEAVARARHNALLGGVDGALAVEAANAFDLLRRHEGEGRRYDLVVLDPPALAKRKSALPAAERAYKELNLRALRLLEPGGVLVTCSCSGRVTPAAFGRIVESAAADAGRAVQLLERRGAGRDHPPLLGVPETEYLKCWILRAL